MPQLETALYEKLPDGSARCGICERRCVIAEGGTGWCRTRKNRGGKIYSTSYGMVSTRHIAPIEAKPVFHFFPGSRWLSLGSVGCNFRCCGCQNWEIAHFNPELQTAEAGETLGAAGAGPAGSGPAGAGSGGAGAAVRTEPMEPRKVVALAKEAGCKGISWTYNEPTMWLEYTARVNELAKKEGLYTNYVTNGYMTRAALDLIGPNLDVFRVDIKGFSGKSYSKVAAIDGFEPVLENALRAKSKWDMHVEVVTNVIPGLNDTDVELGRLATWIATGLGKRTPWHLTRFVPYLELSDVPCTPIATLDRARQIGFDVGLLYVYTGNVAGHPGENTYCPKCGRVVIGRYHFSLIAYNLKTESETGAGQAPQPAHEWRRRGHAGADAGAPGPARCTYCGQRVAGVFE
jgi:pyruvate formate lyase activating enzyme